MKVTSRKWEIYLIKFISYIVFLAYCFFIIYLSKGDDNILTNLLKWFRKTIPNKEIAEAAFSILIILLPAWLIFLLTNKLCEKISNFKFLSKL